MTITSLDETETVVPPRSVPPSSPRESRSGAVLSLLIPPLVVLVITVVAWSWYAHNRGVGVFPTPTQTAQGFWHALTSPDDWKQTSVRVPAGTEISSNSSAILRLMPETEEALERIAKRADEETNPIVMSSLGFLSLGDREAGG